MTDTPRTGVTELQGHASLDCPKCGTTLHTEDALIRGQIADGLRFQGLACPNCGKSFTVEITKSAEDS